jgi:aryl-alcohol dehydrogenase-like predicted oxidoreductase
MLSGKYNDAVDAPPDGSRFSESKDGFAEKMRETYGDDSWQENIAKVRELKSVSDELGVSQSQLAIAWCLKNPNVTSVITGASRPEQIVENVKALQILDKLTPEVMAKVDGITGNKVVLDPARQG